ncbi:hypothetical protein TNCV_1697121 [Trichonephila clavipes]|nr:hypothetical protein TNCV_1697121 [Trichonephila clavipes]
MCIGQAEPLNEGHLCVFSDTSGCLDDQQETSESQMNCSVMMSPELSDNRETSYPNYSGNFLGFSRRPTSRQPRRRMWNTGFLLVIMLQSSLQSLAD